MFSRNFSWTSRDRPWPWRSLRWVLVYIKWLLWICTERHERDLLWHVCLWILEAKGSDCGRQRAETRQSFIPLVDYQACKFPREICEVYWQLVTLMWNNNEVSSIVKHCFNFRYLSAIKDCFLTSRVVSNLFYQGRTVQDRDPLSGRAAWCKIVAVQSVSATVYKYFLAYNCTILRIDSLSLSLALSLFDLSLNIDICIYLTVSYIIDDAYQRYFRTAHHGLGCLEQAALQYPEGMVDMILQVNDVLTEARPPVSWTNGVNGN